MGKWFGLSNTQIHRAWTNIKQRCNNPNCPDFKDYGERGIKVCDEWVNDFKAFYDWSTSNGFVEGLTIDRIDTNGDYEPSNCRWVSMAVQANNRRCNISTEINGEIVSLKKLSDTHGLKYTTIYMRYRAGKRGDDLIEAI